MQEDIRATLSTRIQVDNGEKIDRGQCFKEYKYQEKIQLVIFAAKNEPSLT